MAKDAPHMSKEELNEDAFVEGMVQVADYAKKNQRSLIIAAVVLVAVFVGVQWYRAAKADAASQANILLKKAVSLYEQESYEEADPLFNQVVKEYRGSDAAGYATYYSAMGHLNREDFEAAKHGFQKYLDSYHHDPLVSATCVAGLASCADSEGEYEEAGHLFKKAATEYPDNIWASRHLFLAALSLEKAGKYEDARITLEHLKEKFPDSVEARDVEFYLARLEIMQSTM